MAEGPALDTFDLADDNGESSTPFVQPLGLSPERSGLVVVRDRFEEGLGAWRRRLFARGDLDGYARRGMLGADPGVREGARDERLNAHPTGVAVERDREVECVDPTPKLGIVCGERPGEVGGASQGSRRRLEVDCGRTERSESWCRA